MTMFQTLRQAHIVEDEARRRGVTVGYRRVKRLVEQHRLFETIPVRASAQLMALEDHRKTDQVAREIRADDTLGKLEKYANELLDRLSAAVPGLIIENAHQLASVTSAATNVIRVIAAARDTLAGLGKDREPDGPVAGGGGYLSQADVFKIYGPRRREVLEREADE